ncbi:phosphate acetyltransferase [Rhodococcus sp. BP-252]|uniref:phosphate acetyltransferase n=1 Tax=unclassified Rhodococcus (in: high G+C Gram-positive bacteria) TaxID=192944 RepID=UPI001C9B3FA3|nr:MULTISPECIES: phosphate acetyltransferase [unclassified Rhodococcus (in: high G+C Gram-positive bacteria)]MBY6412510.1 phosphate acetyltransferase [Rhodococcus sp. BP-320]MBY6417235.1 phosphate acetyltransferase [Rhodococcus sp. BP-321]MBY6424160.1 phosphate acetyltransferase [Rhodococcus sp. BP-324]MBY6427259.1 phosphate acetyltransferase [Rhodococcus sp. BP-323]MBY6432128.1 phosphate acetyltransferase [Rhodococcus sp. BP-322]
MAERASSIYIASPEGDTGKSTIALGVLQMLCASAARVGVFRPIARSTDEPDYILELLVDHTTADLSYEQSLGVTYEEVHADPDAALGEIVSRFHDVAAQCDAVVIVGSDYTDVGSPSELSFNARIAANLGAPVLLSLRGSERSPDEIVQLAQLSQSELRANHAHLVAIVANRCDPDRLDDVTAALEPLGVPAWSLPEIPLLVAPTMAELLDAVDGTLYSGDSELMQREALRVMVGGMTAEHILERLTEGVVVIAPGDRSDVLLALVNAHEAEGFPSLAGIIMNGGIEPHPAIARLVAGLGPRLPILTTDLGTFDTASAAAKARGRVAVGSQRKVDTALSLMEQRVDAQALLDSLELSIPSIMTPQMFEYQLIQRARADRKHIVLPEGNDDRILRAAGRLLQRQVAELTILGEEGPIRRRAAELGVSLDGVAVLDPKASDHAEEFAADYTEIRKRKGMTIERAREIMTDISYFGTMMVHKGIADGMVSGAAHTTAHTIRPSFEIIKTAAGVNTVSSIFLMCLSDRVLAYGDCAIVPDPTAEQLADIAISSAQTSAQFGIDPRVAMLSYSTGDSGSGADVDKVREATKLVRERSPELLVEGPIQYDAAIEPSVAKSKLPDSEVAGRATVFIFPDLNTGNNTYKAVQRSAGAVAVGPVLQGLAKPVNDLSRGALVEDIVNTVAITAIQAQGSKEA